MKKKLLKLSVVLVVIISIAISVSSVNLNSWDSFKFAKLGFDGLGNITGCEGTGTSCMILY